MGTVNASRRAECRVAKCLAPILRRHDAVPAQPNPQVIVWIDANLAEIGRARIGSAHAHPVRTFVFASEDATLGVLHQRINNVRVAAIYIERDAAGVAVWQTACELVPGGAPVGGLIDRAFRPAAVVSSGCSTMLVGRCV